MGRFCWIVIGVSLVIPAPAQANCEDAQALRGNVQSVIVSEGQLWMATGAERGKIRAREKWAFSQDRTTITITRYDSNFALLSFLNIWSTTICEFDATGKLLRSRWKPNGVTIESTEERTYDAEGRLLTVKSDDAPDRVLTYTYSGNTKTARHPAHNPITYTTERDTSGRITKETRRDEGEAMDAVVEYRYGSGTVETIGRDHDKTWHSISRIDVNGNTISSSSLPSCEVVNTTQFDYDPQGNWIKRVQPHPQIKISSVDIRQIVYYPN
jgi:YD repeat-containing protein